MDNVAKIRTTAVARTTLPVTSPIRSSEDRGSETLQITRSELEVRSSSLRIRPVRARSNLHRSVEKRSSGSRTTVIKFITTCAPNPTRTLASHKPIYLYICTTIQITPFTLKPLTKNFTLLRKKFLASVSLGVLSPTSSKRPPAVAVKTSS